MDPVASMAQSVYIWDEGVWAVLAVFVPVRSVLLLALFLVSCSSMDKNDEEEDGEKPWED